MNKASIMNDDLQQAPMTCGSTFRELVAEKHDLEFKLRKLQIQAIRKCLDEGWDDCLTVNWNKVQVRSR